ncbi:MAG: NAD(+) synthase [Acetatifactor sp.]|nr:NAD(+) synthase [Acetatifactor sp.]
MNFNAEQEARHIVSWIQNWFSNKGAGTTAVIGISGGKDSTIAAALTAKALGPDRVLGVLIPNGHQADLDDAKRVVRTLGICGTIVNIGGVTAAIEQAILDGEPVDGEKIPMEITSDIRINIPPRVRMTILRAHAQSHGRLINTCNLSENYIGYSTKDGDGTGDLAPLEEYTVTELIQIGLTDYLSLPHDLVVKTPADGLCGKSDEENIGFSYAVLDRFIRTGKCDDSNVLAMINKRHNANKHKLALMDSCKPLFI